MPNPKKTHRARCFYCLEHIQMVEVSRGVWVPCEPGTAKKHGCYEEKP